MSTIAEVWKNAFTQISIHYIQFVFKTSKVVKTGNTDFLCEHNAEKFIIGFWHGDSYCSYPVLRDSGVYIVTTVNARGDYIAKMSEYFGYIPTRLPDTQTSEERTVDIIRKLLRETKTHHIALALDGPLGPYHIPQKFGLRLASLTKKRILPVTIKAKRKLRLMARWDKFMIPLPFSTLEYHFHDPLEVNKNELDSVSKKLQEL